MDKKPKAISEDDVIRSLNNVDEDPANFDTFIENWNSIFRFGQLSQEETFDEVEAAALASVASMNEVVPNSSVGRQVGHLLEQFDSPVYLVRDTGRIIAQNSAAVRTYGLGNHGTLDDLPFDLERDEAIADVVRASLNPHRNIHDAVLKRAYSNTDDTTATLSIAPSKPIGDNKGEALVFVIDARWKTAAAGLIKREFDLSVTEQELLVGFLDGQTTQSMAETRKRAHATIRTQFHSLMGKMGARTQTELFRNALSVSQFVDQIEEISEVIRHPHRKRVDLVRPGGRSVEVTMAGDYAGLPIVFLQSGVTYRFTSEIEQLFYEAGFCALSICRPGYGDTDPPLDGVSFTETFAEDLEALLDQLGHSTCLLMSSNTSSAIMYSVSSRLSSRTIGLVQVAACVPLIHFNGLDTSAPWAQAILRAAEKHPNLKEFMVKSGMRAWKVLGQARFMAMQFRGNAAELENVMKPEVLQESQKALDVATKQGFDALIRDAPLSFADFTDDVLSTELPILVVHGDQDSVFPIDAIRGFAAAHPNRVCLVELPGAGFSAMATHTAAIIDHITNFSKELT